MSTEDNKAIISRFYDAVIKTLGLEEVAKTKTA